MKLIYTDGYSEWNETKKKSKNHSWANLFQYALEKNNNTSSQNTVVKERLHWSESECWITKKKSLIRYWNTFQFDKNVF